MTQLRIPKGKPKWIDADNIMDYTFIIKVEILDIIEQYFIFRLILRLDCIISLSNITVILISFEY
jgi:hypothetical protein